MPKFKKIKEVKSKPKKIERGKPLKESELEKEIEESELEKFIKMVTEKISSENFVPVLEQQTIREQLSGKTLDNESSEEDKKQANYLLNQERNLNVYTPNPVGNQIPSVDSAKQDFQGLIELRENKIQQNDNLIQRENIEDRKYVNNQNNKFEERKSRRWRM